MISKTPTCGELMTENGRIVCNRCEKARFDKFIKRVQGLSALMQKKHKPADQNVLQERYTFACGNKNISIVYETNSGTLVITAAEPFLPMLKTELDQSKTEAQNLPSIATKNLPKAPQNLPNLQKTNKTEQRKPEPKRVEQNKPTELKLPPEQSVLSKPNQINIWQPDRLKIPSLPAEKPKKDNPIIENKQQNKNQPDKKQTDIKQADIKQPSKNQSDIKQADVKQQNKNQSDIKQADIKQPGKNQPNKKPTEIKQVVDKKQIDTKSDNPLSDEQKKLDDLYKNGYAIKNYQPERLEGVIKSIKSLKGVSCRQTPSEPSSQNYQITDLKNKVYLRYIESKKTLQLQGRRSKLFGEIQVLVSQGSDYATAVSSHIDLTGEEKRAGDMEKRLKKLLPNAFDFLSEQSRIDITIGMMDIANDEVKLSDYSMLLVPPYRGLERLIYDLQKIKGIEVKMIGQAYEKTPDGDYTLKLGYRRKINSIVYGEVMSALYTEYFAKRNFYAHSDITGDLLSRVITEKSAVKEIFNKLTQIIEYNIIKLKEIGLKT